MIYIFKYVFFYKERFGGDVGNSVKHPTLDNSEMMNEP